MPWLDCSVSEPPMRSAKIRARKRPRPSPRPASLVVKNGSPARWSISGGHAPTLIADERRDKPVLVLRDVYEDRATDRRWWRRSAFLTSDSSAWPNPRAAGEPAVTSGDTVTSSRAACSRRQSSPHIVDDCADVDELRDRRPPSRRRVRSSGRGWRGSGRPRRGSAGHPRARVPGAPAAAADRSSSRDARAIVPSGVDSSCAAPAASVVIDMRRSVRAACCRISSSVALAAGERVRGLQDEVGHEFRGDGDRYPHREEMCREVVQPVMHGVELLRVPVHQQAVARDRDQSDERGRPSPERQRRERDLDGEDDAERIERAASQLQESGQECRICRDADKFDNRRHGPPP